MPTENLAILFTDIAGLSDRSASDADRLVAEHEAIVAASTVPGGLSRNAASGARLLTFGSAREALACGRAIQEKARTSGLGARVGIHVAAVDTESSVDLALTGAAARAVAGSGSAGEVLLSAAARDALGDSATAREVGAVALDGSPERLRVFRVEAATPTPPPAPRRSTGLWVVIALAIVGGITGGLVARRMSQPRLERLIDSGALGEAEMSIAHLTPGPDKRFWQARLQEAQGDYLDAVENYVSAARATDELRALALARLAHVARVADCDGKVNVARAVQRIGDPAGRAILQDLLSAKPSSDEDAEGCDSHRAATDALTNLDAH